MHVTAHQIQLLAYNEKHHSDFTASAKTAIYRSSITAPLKCIIGHGLIDSYSSILHYAKGKAQHDSDKLSEFGQVADHDYTYCPNPQALGCHHDYVIANYCLNVLPYESRQFVLHQIASCTRKIAFLSVRTDKIVGEPEGDGVRTKRNTFQKQYRSGEIVAETQEHFKYVAELKLLKNQSGFAIVACSHQPFPSTILAAEKGKKESKQGIFRLPEK